LGRAQNSSGDGWGGNNKKTVTGKHTAKVLPENKKIRGWSERGELGGAPV